MTKNFQEILGGIRVKTFLPISLFSAVPYTGQIEILSSFFSSIEEDDMYRLSSINSTIQKFRERKYSEIFCKEHTSKKMKQTFYEKSCLGMIHLSCSSNDIFSKESQGVLKIIKDKLQSKHLKWVFVITSDNTLVFSLSYNHFLSWSSLLKSHSVEFICLSLINSSILDLIDDDYRRKSYKNSLITLNQVYILINEKEISKDTNKSHQPFLQELLKFNTFETSHNYFKSYFEGLLSSTLYISSKEALNDVLRNLKKQSETKISDKIRILELLEITPICLLEITPFIIKEKLRGQFYTPLELTVSLIINSFQSKNLLANISALKILDPACGTGILLVVAIEFVVNQLILRDDYKSFSSLRKSVFYSNITGMDIDERLVNYCKSFFSLYLKSSSVMLESDTPIVHNNFLEYFVYNYNRNPLTFTKYDLILSNPPYIPLHSRFMKNVLSDKLKKELQDIIPLFMGKRDNLYVMFLGLALEHLTNPKHGIVGFIVDSSFLDLPSYKLLRKNLLSSYNLQYLLSQYKFDRAVVDLSIVIFDKSKNNDNSFLWQRNIKQSPVQQQIADILDQPNFSYSIQLNPEVRNIIKTIQDRSVLLDDVCHISCGLEYGSLLKTHFLSPVKELDYFKVIDGANGLPQSFVLFWVGGWRNSYVRVSREFEEHLKLNDLDRSPIANKKVLLISGNKERFIEPKIIIRQTASRFIATFDEDGYFGLRNLHIVHSFNELYSPLLILGILSSKLGTSLGKALNIIRGSGDSTNRYPQIRVGDLKRFPIIDISKAVNCQLKKMKIEELVKECLNIGRELADIYNNIWDKILEITGDLPVSSQKRFFLLLDSPKKLNLLPKEVLNEITELINQKQLTKQLLEQKQKQIDEIVVNIYGLTKENWFELNLENDGMVISS